MSDRKNTKPSMDPKESLREEDKKQKSAKEEDHHDDMHDDEYVKYNEERRRSLESAFKHTMDQFEY